MEVSGKVCSGQDLPFLGVVCSKSRMKVPSSGPRRGEGGVLQGFWGRLLGTLVCHSQVPPKRGLSPAVSSCQHAGYPALPESDWGPTENWCNPPAPSHWSLTRYPTEGLSLVLDGLPLLP